MPLASALLKLLRELLVLDGCREVLLRFLVFIMGKSSSLDDADVMTFSKDS